MHSYYILDWFQESDLLPLIENAVEETVLVEHVNKSYKRLRNDRLNQQIVGTESSAYAGFRIIQG
jgi:hypothetical protein